MSFFSGLAKLANPALGFNLLKPKAGPNPANAAMPYLSQLQGLGNEAYNPYIQQGQRQDPILEQQYAHLLNNPAAFLDSLMKSYKPSEGYRFKQEELSRGLGNTAAAGGFRGTPFEQQQQGELINNLLSQDMQNYLAQVLGIYGQGLQGTSGLSDRGFNAATGRADYLGNALGAQGGLAFQGQAQQNANRLAGKNAQLNFLSSLIGGGPALFGGQQWR